MDVRSCCKSISLIMQSKSMKLLQEYLVHSHGNPADDASHMGSERICKNGSIHTGIRLTMPATWDPNGYARMGPFIRESD